MENLFAGCSEYERETVKLMVPVLIDRLQLDNPTITYSDLAAQIGRGRRHLSHPLYKMMVVFNRISPRPPYLNALVVKKLTGLPGCGLINVDPRYGIEDERFIMNDLNAKAKAFTHWDEVNQIIKQG